MRSVFRLEESARAASLALLALGLLSLCGAAGCEDSPPPVNASTVRVLDPASLLDAEGRQTLDDRLGLLFRELGIDLRFEFVRPSAGRGTSEDPSRRYQALGVGGHNTEGRGILLVYDLDSEKLQIEVGYGLEAIFPDAFVGYLIHDNARYLFDSGDPGFALLLTIRMIDYRLHTAALGGDFDPTFVRMIRAARYGSGGGGAAERVPRNRGELESFARAMGPAWRARFSAGTSVEECYQRYVEWLSNGIFDPRVSIFNEKTRAFLETWPMTAAYFDYLLMKEAGRMTEIVEIGDRALLYSTRDPIAAPLFFRRTDTGWQLDIPAQVDEILSIAGGAYAWSFKGLDGAYTRVFADQLTSVDGLLRLSRGDNRPTPVYQ